MLLVNRYYLIALLFILSCAHNGATQDRPNISHDIDYPRPSLENRSLETSPDSLDIGELDIETGKRAEYNQLTPHKTRTND